MNRAVSGVALTVLMSVILHGITAGPGGGRYVQSTEQSTASVISTDDRIDNNAVWFSHEPGEGATA